MTEAISLLESQASNLNNKTGEEVGVLAAPDLDDILVKLRDPSRDPFEKMMIVMAELMPAITEWKEDELEGLSDSLEQLSIMTDLIATAQTHFNNLKDSADAGEAKAYIVALEGDGENVGLRTKIDESTYLDDDLKSQLLDTVDDMIEFYNGLGSDQNAANTIYNYQNGIGSWNSKDGDAYIKDPTQDGLLKTEFLDNFNKVGTGLKNTSGVVQARFQFEVGNYETYLGVYKDMFRNWKGQLQSPLEGIKRAG